MKRNWKIERQIQIHSRLSVIAVCIMFFLLLFVTGVIVGENHNNDIKNSSETIVSTETELTVGAFNDIEKEVVDVEVETKEIVLSEEPEDNKDYYLDVNCPEYIQDIVYEVSNEYGISFTFMMALIEKESDFQVDCVSKTHDYGLCQINRSNLSWLAERGITDVWDVRQNITGGCMMLADLFEKYEEPHLVLMAYNMGETGAKRHWKKGTYSSKYSRWIMNRAEEFDSYLYE